LGLEISYFAGAAQGAGNLASLRTSTGAQDLPILVRTGYQARPASGGDTTELVTLRHTDYVTCDGPMGRRHRVLGRLSEPHYPGQSEFCDSLG
jgi:hypothetical protein